MPPHARSVSRRPRSHRAPKGSARHSRPRSPTEGIPYNDKGINEKAGAEVDKGSRDLPNPFEEIDQEPNNSRAEDLKVKEQAQGEADQHVKPQFSPVARQEHGKNDRRDDDPIQKIG